MAAKAMFEKLGYDYKYIDGKSMNCEDTILYVCQKQDLIIQFNLLSKIVVYQMNNTMKEYEKIVMFITKELIQAINKQIEELGWLDKGE